MIFFFFFFFFLDLLEGMENCGYVATLIEGYFSNFSLKPYVVTTHLNHLHEMVQMRGHNIYFNAELTNIIPNYHQTLPLI